MKKSIKQIEKLGISTHSYIRAVQEANEKNYTKDLLQTYYNAIMNTVEKFATEPEARYHFCYAIQEVIRYFNQGETDLDKVKSIVKDRVRDLKERSPGNFVVKANLESQKLTRKEYATQVYITEIKDKGLSNKEAIDILCSRLGVLRSTASTYYYKFKKSLE